MNLHTQDQAISRHTSSSMVFGKTQMTGINFWLDSALAIVALSAIVSAYQNPYTHKWLASAMAVLVTMHLARHRAWIRICGKRIFHKMPVRTWFKLVIDAVWLIDFLLLASSGIVIATIYAPHITRFHTLCSITFMSLLLFHLTLNWKWITRNMKQRINQQQKYIGGP